MRGDLALIMSIVPIKIVTHLQVLTALAEDLMAARRGGGCGCWQGPEALFDIGLA